jgi:hypothetical protein
MFQKGLWKYKMLKARLGIQTPAPHRRDIEMANVISSECSHERVLRIMGVMKTLEDRWQ